jgi:hypothetical protein
MSLSNHRKVLFTSGSVATAAALAGRRDVLSRRNALSRSIGRNRTDRAVFFALGTSPGSNAMATDVSCN